ncbi:MAG TPA: M23 family metallopeptidase [Rhizomicrobium sp.]|nr:M23 family metallopeptidase [Rhizomicrobium sp.]
MIARRAFLLGSGGLVLLPNVLCADEARLKLTGSLEQGSLVVGHAPGAVVTVDAQKVQVSADGLFAFGFAYDQTKPTTVSASFADGRKETRDVAPVARHYDVQTINGLPEKYVSPPADVLARIARENALVVEARKRDTAPTFFAETFDWPIAGIVSGTWGNRRIDNGKPMAPHFGVDIAAPEGTPIHAPADGTVSLAEPDFYLTGGTLLIDHGHGVSTTYIHQSALKVKEGDAVKRGDVIGLVGMKGRATGPHLHWSMSWFQMRLDPSRSTAAPMPPKA